MLKYFALLSILLFSFSCTTKQIVVQEKKLPILNTEQILFDSIQKKHQLPNFEQLRIQGKIDLKFKDEIPELNLNMYVEKNQKIWTNVSFLIFSARSLITPTKVQAYEKIKRTYIDSDFNYVNDLLGLDFIDFDNTQKLLLGRICFPFKLDDFHILIQNEEYRFTSKTALTVGKGKDKKNYDRTIIFNSDYSLKSIFFEDKIKNESVLIEYVNKIQNQGIELPNLVKIRLKNSNNKDINLKYTTFDQEKMETPFRIPENYSERKF